ncbi:CsbD family protein [Synechococcus sp. CCY 9618]|uniref:CsbD family protein n=1 Tax=Synechococcus sp. CCY 9618 TaxID=2815602 RepID=UPI001C218F29|nr:CsbD family protein [Synechococcus sp. CCY 9618]
MSNKSDATAKETEGRLESALGELTGDAGHQLKGKAKQVQALAMNAAEDLKQGAKSVADKVSDAANQLADRLD